MITCFSTFDSRYCRVLLLMGFLLTGIATVAAQNLQPPVFSHETGVYRDNITVALSHPNPDVDIYVNVGAAAPLPLPGFLYSASIEVSDRSDEPNYWSEIPTNYTDGSYHGFLVPRSSVPKATIIRAMAVDEDGNTSRVVTKTYWIHPDESFRFYTPVISVVAEYDDFFGHERGIYVPGVNGDPSSIREGNFNMRGVEWERPGVFSMIDSSGAHIHTQNVGYRIHGGWTRYFPAKSLRIYARNEYEDRVMPVELFPGEGVQPYRRFLLRPSGNDQGLSMIRDALAQHLVSHLSFDTQGYQPAIVYLNGEYWGIHNIRDRYTRHFLERVHGVDPDQVDILEKEAEIKEGSNAHYLDMLDFARNSDLSDAGNFSYMEARMDMQNFIEYAASQVYYANNDWPHNNIDFWRYSGTPGEGVMDGRWRWLMFDVDRSFGLGSNVTTNMISWMTRELDNNGEEWPNALFRNLLENESFKQDFINTILDLLNTVFEPEYVIAALDNFAAVIEPEMPRHVQRWQRPVSTVAWHNTLFSMRSFANQRPERVIQHLEQYFSPGSLEDLIIYSDLRDGGYVKVNYMPLLAGQPGISFDNNRWSGRYFDAIPVRLSVVPSPGYRFEQWELVDTVSRDTTVIFDRVIQAFANGDVVISPVFRETDAQDSELDPVPLRDEDFVMNFWPKDGDEGLLPGHLEFVYMDQTDPLITAEIAGFTDGAFDLDNRTRVIGLNEEGIAFINTGNEEGNPGYPGTRLGGAVMAIDTREKERVAIDWTAGTVYSNSRIYNIRLQYRIGSTGDFEDVTDSNGQPIEYEANAIDGHRMDMSTGYLPVRALEHPHVELFWRYYFTGVRVDSESGQRSKLAIHSIRVHGGDISSIESPELPSVITLQAFPNPFNTQTTIQVESLADSDVMLKVYDMMGRRIHTLYEGPLPAGFRTFTWDASAVASGVYMIIAETADEVSLLKVTLVK